MWAPQSEFRKASRGAALVGVEAEHVPLGRFGFAAVPEDRLQQIAGAPVVENWV